MSDITSREVWTEWCKQRVTYAMLLMAVAFGVLALRLVYLQVLQGDRLHRLSENNAIRLESLDPTRGLILDSGGVILADNRPRFDICLVPRDAKPRETILPLLACLLGMDQKEIEDKIGKAASFQPVLIKDDVGRDVLGIVEARRYELPGVVVRVKPQRHFPGKGTTAHIVGYLSEISLDELRSSQYPNRKSGDFIGKYGIEKEFEPYLAGKHGGRQVEADARGRTVRIMDTVFPEPGNNVYLTLDMDLQKKAEELLEGRAGALVAMEAQTGKILAMVSSPSYDPNLFVDGMTRKQWNELVKDPDNPLENKAIHGGYAPGSIYKMITAMAGLENGVLTQHTQYNCPGRLKFGDRYFRCWKHYGHGTLEVTEAIAQSCDVFFYKVGLDVGVDKIAEFARGCGLGQVTGLGLGNESPGVVPDKAWKQKVYNKPWYQGETLSVAIGQGANLVTPLQMARFAAAIGNGGALYQSMLVDRVEDPEGILVEKFTPKMVGELPVSPENLELIREGMWGAVNGPRGTARGICPSDLDISGKTGTAQVVGRKDRDKFMNELSDKIMFQDHAWFIAYAPRENCQIAVAVFIKNGEHGTACAPLARDLIEAYMDEKKEILPGTVASREQAKNGD
ncbi:MAG: penicillin-binding protein 2 [Desulfatibacillum sp.]|nr:penicillin-binding protein 2 [Desulfatibacillum sp.]